MTATPVYSTLFQCLYDQPAPIGALGYGAHYSVFRTWESHDVELRPCAPRQIHDFAVIWDEDHDDRVLRVIEALIANNLFSPVQFVGEHKATIYLIVAARTLGSLAEAGCGKYLRDLEEVVHRAMPTDSWRCVVGMVDRHRGEYSFAPSHQNDPKGIVGAPEHITVGYLLSIDAQWQLGTRSWNWGHGFPPGTWPGDGWGSMQRDHAKTAR